MTTTFASRYVAAALDPAAFAPAVGFTPDPWQAQPAQGHRTRLDRALQPSVRQVGLRGRRGPVPLPVSARLPVAVVLGRAAPGPGGAARRHADVQAHRRSGGGYQRERQPALENKSRLLSLPSQSPATVRGYTPNFIVVDEAAQCSDELYQALRPMQLVSGANMWLLSTPFGKRGFFYEQWTEGGDRWRRVKITAEQCPRIDPSS